jgi:hypothetical protein
MIGRVFFFSGFFFLIFVHETKLPSPKLYGEWITSGQSQTCQLPPWDATFQSKGKYLSTNLQIILQESLICVQGGSTIWMLECMWRSYKYVLDCPPNITQCRTSCGGPFSIPRISAKKNLLSLPTLALKVTWKHRRLSPDAVQLHEKAWLSMGSRLLSKMSYKSQHVTRL